MWVLYTTTEHEKYSANPWEKSFTGEYASKFHHSKILNLSQERERLESCRFPPCTSPLLMFVASSKPDKNIIRTSLAYTQCNGQGYQYTTMLTDFLMGSLSCPFKRPWYKYNACSRSLVGNKFYLFSKLIRLAMCLI